MKPSPGKALLAAAALLALPHTGAADIAAIRQADPAKLLIHACGHVPASLSWIYKHGFVQFFCVPTYDMQEKYKLPNRISTR